MTSQRFPVFPKRGSNIDYDGFKDGRGRSECNHSCSEQVVVMMMIFATTLLVALKVVMVFDMNKHEKDRGDGVDGADYHGNVDAIVTHDDDHGNVDCGDDEKDDLKI
jgi:hypothetical protein